MCGYLLVHVGIGIKVMEIGSGVVREEPSSPTHYSRSTIEIMDNSVRNYLKPVSECLSESLLEVLSWEDLFLPGVLFLFSMFIMSLL
jgi:hypothetical protein